MERSVSGTETHDRTTGNRTNCRGEHDQKRKAHAILSRGGPWGQSMRRLAKGR